MTKIWDESMRTLVRNGPQAFIDLVTPEAVYVGKRPEKLKNWQLEVDALLEVQVGESKMLLHLEFQTYRDAKMSERLLRYNVLARSEYDCPVLSCVIYLLKDGSVQPPHLDWEVPTGQAVLHFSYVIIEIGELTPDEIFNAGQPALLPFLPLTKGGATRGVVQRMFAELEKAESKDLALVGFTLASLVFSRSNQLDREWLQRSFRAMNDILRETPIYQEILQEGKQKGLQEGMQKGKQEGIQEGIQEGMQKGKLQNQQQMIIDIIKIRFANLVPLARAQVMLCDKSSRLEPIIAQLIIAQDEETVASLLLHLLDV